MFGKFQNNILTLEEEFFWTDGEKQKRVWKIKKIDEHNYIGTAPDVIGEAKGFSYGSAFKFEYDLMIPIKGKVQFQQNSISELQIVGNMYIISGKYFFNLMGNEKIPARFSFLINTFHENPIMHHHSSQSTGI